jgi:RNA 3'-terminal phosphate cyclase (ATP)
MITIDGSVGEGGGQILRSSLALAMCTQQAVQIVNIRAKRRKPGLMRQHLTALQAAGKICRAKISGDRIGSCEVTFRPGAVQAGEYAFSVGTAGSTSLVFQTILPALTLASGKSRVVLEGGTHNPMAPPFDFIGQAFLPLLNRMGPKVSAELQRPGFYPAGGGRWSVEIQPCEQLKPLHLSERGEIKQRRAVAVCAGLPKNIARRELETVAKMTSWGEDCLVQQQLPDEYGPGNYLNMIIRSEQVTEVFTGFGQHGVSAEKVAQDCVRRVRRYLAADVAVAEYLADQLILPMALAGGGEFTSIAPSQHVLTNIEVIQRFLPVRFEVEQIGGDAYRVGC